MLSKGSVEAPLVSQPLLICLLFLMKETVWHFYNQSWVLTREKEESYLVTFNDLHVQNTMQDFEWLIF